VNSRELVNKKPGAAGWLHWNRTNLSKKISMFYMCVRDSNLNNKKKASQIKEPV